MSIQDALIIGFLQGLLEWLPVSSKSMVILYLVNAAALKGEVAYLVAIFLHFSTATSALFMFRSEYWAIVKSLIMKREKRDNEATVLFRSLVGASIISIGVGGPLYLLAKQYILEASGFILNASVGLLIIAVGLLLKISSRSGGQRTAKDIDIKDIVYAGIAQGLAALPGLSRSGLVASALLLRDLDKEAALRFTFIISVPLIYGIAVADLVLGFGLFQVGLSEAGPQSILLASLVTFIASLYCLKALLKLAARLDFSRFLLSFGGLTFLLTVVFALIR